MNKRNKLLGQHLVAPRKYAPFEYEHHGICISPTKVIHYSGAEESRKKGPVKPARLSDFVGSSELYVRNYKNRKNYSSDSIERALSKLGEDKYNLILNNCEHFATWCMIGNSLSRQVRINLTSLGQIGSALLIPIIFVNNAISHLMLKKAMDQVSSVFQEVLSKVEYEDIKVEEYIERADHPSGKASAFYLWRTFIDGWYQVNYKR